ncbi:hypothetical protein SS1G_13081 [Sclerotinia sclerotiorum 1980 UF-70]|uniref:Uncharacterized protein n=1 Tax=Sclerotinia sclerotiorum (strain ATCC 18683 / 1980 / Ss-1) TaxID=665079 RepID=A7F653_SCLS1|nr:hypothetical protein SS1G_13081 [Sclerotinia sclerotiorum 1980 UF-70]EDN98224.1 hypothetical protein SS1G_13081 [Sclerotinia sclerotiorum 1980 UF-70]
MFLIMKYIPEMNFLQCSDDSVIWDRRSRIEIQKNAASFDEYGFLGNGVEIGSEE